MISSFQKQIKFKNGTSGFTLIEVLLGMAIFSVVAVAIYSVFSAGIMISRRARDEGEKERAVYWMSRQIRQDIEHAIMISGENLPSGIQMLRFAGAKDSLVFLRETSAGLIQVRWFCQEMTEDNVCRLTRQENLLGTGFVINDGEVREELFCDLSVFDGIRFFFGIKTEQGDWIWQEEWSESQPPARVRVIMRLASAEENVEAEAVPQDSDLGNDADMTTENMLVLDVFNPCGASELADKEETIP